MNTILTIKQQKEFLSNNWRYEVLEHAWSCRGMGNSKILDADDDVISKAGGCGYDRFGTAFGDAMEFIFKDELNKLAKKVCKTGKRLDTRKTSDLFYGLFYNSKTGEARVDGGCGYDCMFKILNAIGFSVEQIKSCERGQTGSAIYKLTPLTKNDREWMNR